MLKTAEVKTALTAWGLFLAGMTAYCMVYQAIVRASTPDLPGSLLLWLREWGIWLLATPLVFKALTHYEGLGRRLAASLPWAAAVVLVCMAFPVVFDYVTNTRSTTSSVTIYLPRCVAALIIVYLVWRAFLRNKAAAQNRRYPETLLVSKGADECLVQVARVQHLSAAGNYVEVHADGQLYIMRATMKQAEELLPPSQFVRIHRSHIVNIREIERIKAQRSGNGTVHLRCGRTLSLSKKYRAELLKYRLQTI
jgi:LytTr DNA-binding domain